MFNIFYKEYLKTRWYSILMLIAFLCFTTYALMRINYILTMKGADHLWNFLIMKDVVLVEILEFVPLVGGIILALVQFMPEMYHKSLKLTLHLPFSPWKMINVMLIYGALVMLIVCAINLIVMLLYLHRILPIELYSRIVLTTIPWHLAGLAGYFLTSWICIEPAWRRRIANIIIASLFMFIYFLSTSAEAYNSFLPLLTIATLLTSTFSWLSVARFKEGKE